MVVVASPCRLLLSPVVNVIHPFSPLAQIFFLATGREKKSPDFPLSNVSRFGEKGKKHIFDFGILKREREGESERRLYTCMYK